MLPTKVGSAVQQAQTAEHMTMPHAMLRSATDNVSQTVTVNSAVLQLCIHNTMYKDLAPHNIVAHNRWCHLDLLMWVIPS